MIVLGRITAPYGVRGWLKLHPFGDDPAAWRTMKRWWLGEDDEEFSGWRAFPVQTLRAQGRGWVAKLVGIDDRTAAEGLVGHYVGAPRGELPATQEGEYYWADLIGLTVVNEDNQPLGAVAEMIESGAHAVMVVKDDKTQRLLPFVGQVVKDVDVRSGVIRVDWGPDW